MESPLPPRWTTSLVAENPTMTTTSTSPSRLCTQAATLLLALAFTACGDPPIEQEPDAHVLATPDAFVVAEEDAAATPEDAARTQDAGVDAGDRCAPFAGCGTCTNQAGCGFCPSNGECMSGRASGPTTTGACVWGWTYLPERCTTSTDPCLLRGSSCGACTSASGCGWCGPANRCMSGSEAGPTGTTCTVDWSFGSGMCE